MKHIYVDMDGVLVNLNKADYRNLPKAEKWAKINSIDHFYLNLEPMQGSWKLMAYLEHHFGRENMTILTLLARRVEQCASDKILWMNRQFDWPAHKIICTYEHKYPWGQFGDYLIDDTPRNIDEWIAAGGRGILFEDTNQVLRELDFQMRTGLLKP